MYNKKISKQNGFIQFFVVFILLFSAGLFVVVLLHRQVSHQAITSNNLVEPPHQIPNPEQVLIPARFASPSANTKQQQSSDNDTSYDIGVLVLRYFPLTKSGQLDTLIMGNEDGNTYDSLRQASIDETTNLLNFIPKATTYLGYKDPAAQPSLRYHLVDTKEFQTPIPTKVREDRPTYIDYDAVMKSVNICDYIDNKGVKEIWISTYKISDYYYFDESKMSSKYGDISNSRHYNDMPLCTHSYVVYTSTYDRGGSGGLLHGWGHQIEEELRAVDSTFLSLFQGTQTPPLTGQPGRCGWVHFPPNAVKDYDYANTKPYKSDCEDWQPDGLGSLMEVSCFTWSQNCKERDIFYLSDSSNPQVGYLIWMWQNLPGRNNVTNYHGKRLRNIWDIHGNFDSFMAGDRSLTL